MNRIVIITGGANGIGRCMAETFWKEGDQIIVIDKQAEAGQALAAKYPERFCFYAGSVAEKETLEAFAAMVRKQFGRVDVLIHNACYSNRGLYSCDYDQFEEILRVGVAAPFYLTKLLMPVLSPMAAIINISSTRADQSQANTESYSAAKGGITALTHAMSVTLAGKARVNAIKPGWIETRDWQYDAQDVPTYEDADKTQHAAGRVGTPHDIAQMALFLADSEKAGFITGQSFTVDGGMSKLMVYHNDDGWVYQP